MDIPIGAGLVALSVPLTLLIYFARNEIPALFAKGFRWKGGGTELNIPPAPQFSPVAGTIHQPAQVVEAASAEPSKELTKEPTTPDDWEAEMFHAAFAERNLEKARLAFEGFQRTEGSAKKKLECEVFYDFLRFVGGDSKALQDLIQLSEKPEAKFEARLWIARCYRYAGDHAQAVAEFDAITSEETAGKYRREAAIDAAGCVFQLDRRDEAYARLIGQLPLANEFEDKTSIYQSLAELYEKAKDPELRALALEKALEYAPNNSKFRFGAAYAYSEVALHKISYVHYTRLLSFSPNDSSALNNLGCAAELLKMPIRSIGYYKQAAEKENTLSSANLAYRYMAAGFMEDAEKVLDAAKASKSMHANVGSAIAALFQNLEYEKTTDISVRAEAAKTQQFLSQFGEAYFSMGSPSRFAGSWFSSEGYFLQIVEKDGRIEGQWEENGTKMRFFGSLSNRAARLTIEVFGFLPGQYHNPTFLPHGRGFVYVTLTDQRLHALYLRDDEERYVQFGKLAQIPGLADTDASPELPKLQFRP